MTRSLFSVIAASCLLLTLGCNGPTRDEGVAPTTAFNNLDGSCQYLFEHNETPDAASTDQLGFSAQSVLESLNARGPVLMTWADGSQTEMSIVFTSQLLDLEVYNPPQFEGNCSPYMEINDLQLHFVTSDGRLDEIVRGQAANAEGFDGHMDSVWVNTIELPVKDVNGALEVFNEPREIPAHTVRQLTFDLGWAFNSDNDASSNVDPFCTLGEQRSLDPATNCNIYDGIITFVASVNDPYSDNHAPLPEGATSQDVLGWWKR